MIVKIKVYFDEEWDSLTYTLRVKKREKEEKGFYIPKDKLNWIRKIEDEYFKTQDYIKMKLRNEGLI